MSYSKYTLEDVSSLLGITTEEAELFSSLPAVHVPDWLPTALARGTRLALVSEKARSECIVTPILQACRELSDDRVSIFSGVRLDVDPLLGLQGECDFILALGPPVPPLRAPVISIVEAKKNDIEESFGQCIAQMVAADKFNRGKGIEAPAMYGCITTGEAWQFLRLQEQIVQINQQRYYLDNVTTILAAFVAIVGAK